MGSAQAREAIADYLEEKGLGGEDDQLPAADWGISRQRYWGAPIPIIYCDRIAGRSLFRRRIFPSSFPINVEVTGIGEIPSCPGSKEFVETSCPRCGGPAGRETDTMDTFVESSWYFDRFALRRITGGTSGPGKGWTTGCRWISISAESSTPSSISSIPDSSPGS